MRTTIFNSMIFSAILTLMISCKDQNKDAEQTAVPIENNAAKDTSDNLKINPAHGQPGHRCDLPVGAPLTSRTAESKVISGQPTSTSVSPIRVDQTPKVNPPHGEPYHDCSIPVGAKLEN